VTRHFKRSSYVAWRRPDGLAVWDCAIGGGGNNCGSTNVNEGFTVVGTNTAGNPTIGGAAGGVSLFSCTVGGMTNCEAGFNLPGAIGTYQFIDVVDNTGDILVRDITAQSVPGPIVGAGLPGIMAACGGLLALARRRRKVLV